jgi:hypothetical protein
MRNEAFPDGNSSSSIPHPSFSQVMKRHLLSLLLVVGGASLTALQAQAQDKPVLNTAPPGPVTTPRPAEPTPVPATPVPTAPVPVQEPVYNTPATTPQPSPDAPSGLNFPNRATTKEGGAEDKPPTKKFIYTNVGLGFSSGYGISQFNVSAAPSLGFRLTKKLAVGPGISYAYNSFSLQDGYVNNSLNGTLTESGSNSISTSSLGFKAFAQYIVYKEFFVHAEYEVTNAQLIFQDYATGYYVKRNQNVTTPLLGVGYRTPISDNAAFDIVGLYNFNNTIYSLYPGLVVRFSLLFNIGK